MQPPPIRKLDLPTGVAGEACRQLDEVAGDEEYAEGDEQRRGGETDDAPVGAKPADESERAREGEAEEEEGQAEAEGEGREQDGPLGGSPGAGREGEDRRQGRADARRPGGTRRSVERRRGRGSPTKMRAATMMKTPAAISSGRRFASRKFPNHAAPAPSATNIAVKPPTNAEVESATRRGRSPSSSNPTPETKER
jgi:hypothetical protein